MWNTIIHFLAWQWPMSQKTVPLLFFSGLCLARKQWPLWWTTTGPVLVFQSLEIFPVPLYKWLLFFHILLAGIIIFQHCYVGVLHYYVVLDKMGKVVWIWTHVFCKQQQNETLLRQAHVILHLANRVIITKIITEGDKQGRLFMSHKCLNTFPPFKVPSLLCWKQETPSQATCLAAGVWRWWWPSPLFSW